MLLSRLNDRLWLGLGAWLQGNGLPGLAETCYRHATVREGKASAEAWFRLSQVLLLRDKNQEAMSACEAGLLYDANNVRLWCAMGAARRRLVEMDAARKAYERALAIDPGYAPAWSNLGEWWLVKGEYEKALGSIEEALRLDPSLREALNNRAAALYELARFKDAEAAARQAIEIYPEEAALHANLGNVLLHVGKSRLAILAFRKALDLDPACSEAHMGLATLLGETGHLAETLKLIKTEIAIKGESAKRLASLALAQQASRDWSAAEATCRKVLDMQPGNVSALVTLAGCLSVRADHRGAIALHRKALASNADMPGICSNIAFDSTYVDDFSPSEVYENHLEWSRRFETPEASGKFRHLQTKNPDRPLRIGYVSGDFGTHPVGFLLRDVIRHHDSNQCYIHCYSMMRGSDPITEAIREGADSWVEALLLSDDDLAAQIHEDHIDILIDLSGHTAYNRLPVFVRKPAPVQATWIGYFHSTGLANIDYFITDPYTTPPGCGQFFSETPVYLPNSRFCYSPPDYAPEVLPSPVLERGKITFGSFNRIEKLVDPVLVAWARIVMGTPNARLVVKAGMLSDANVQRHLADRFVTAGLSRDRLELVGPSQHQEMLAQYGEIDIALDTFPFNGGMTTLEALWSGVPVATVVGNSVVSRQTISALANLGLADELAFPDIDAYVRGAIDLANDIDRLERLRASIRPRMVTSALRQPAQFVQDLERLYREMWQAYCVGKKIPSALKVGNESVPDLAGPSKAEPARPEKQ